MLMALTKHHQSSPPPAASDGEAEGDRDSAARFWRQAPAALNVGRHHEVDNNLGEACEEKRRNARR